MIRTEQIPKLYSSALISLGAFAIGLGAFFGVKFLFPNQNVSSIELMLVTAFGGWLTNFIKLALK